jgi:hypothetical protein
VESQLLGIFAYGTWKDYTGMCATLTPELRLDLNGPAVRKLKKLTIITILSQYPEYSFDEFRKALDLKTAVEVESLVLELVGSDLVIAKIDQQSGTVRCERCVSRCIKQDKDSILKVAQRIGLIRGKINSAIALASPTG